MRFRLLLAFAIATLPAFPVAKEILQLQRDLAQLQDQVRNLQRAVDERMAVSQQLLNQNLDALGKLSTSLAVLEKAIHGQEKVLVAPVANVSARVDTLAGQFQALRDAVEEVNSKLSKLSQQVVDVKNVVTSLPPPASAQPAAAAPATPPVSAENLFRNATRDFQAANYNLAGPQLSDYIKLFGSTEQAADAQFYLGEIFYSQQQYDQAVDAYSLVLDRYPEGKITPDAQYKKGMSLLKQGRSDDASREFREVLRKFPRSDAAAQCKEALAGLGLRPPAGAPKGKAAKK